MNDTESIVKDKMYTNPINNEMNTGPIDNKRNIGRKAGGIETIINAMSSFNTGEALKISSLVDKYHALLGKDPLSAYTLLGQLPVEAAAPFYMGLAERFGKQLDVLKADSNPKQYAAINVLYESCFEKAGYKVK